MSRLRFAYANAAASSEAAAPRQKGATEILIDSIADLAGKNLDGVAAMLRRSKVGTCFEVAAIGAGVMARFALETLPPIAAGLATAAYMAGNAPKDTVDVLEATCSRTVLEICNDKDMLRNMPSQDRLTVSAMLFTSTSDTERKAISAIARTAAKENFDARFMLAIAHLESTVGTNIDADTSTARGLYQYTEDRWLQSLHQWGKSYSPEIAEITKSIRPQIQADGSTAYKVADADRREAILALRDDPELQSFIFRKGTRNSDAVLDLRAFSDDERYEQHLTSIAETFRMGRSYQLVRTAFDDLAQKLGDTTHEDRAQRVQDQQRILVDTIVEGYMPLFMGDTGGPRFLEACREGSVLRDVPIATLIEQGKSPVSSRAVKANEGIFDGGKRTPAQVCALIENKVVKALQMFEARTEEFVTTALVAQTVEGLQRTPFAIGQRLVLASALPVQTNNAAMAYAKETPSLSIEDIIMGGEKGAVATSIRPREKPASVKKDNAAGGVVYSVKPKPNPFKKGSGR